MSTQKQTTTAPETKLFDKGNYMIMIVGIVVMALGFLAMVGGKSPDPTKFNDDVIYSFQRITLAPALIVGGFIIEVFAIMRRPKKAE